MSYKKHFHKANSGCFRKSSNHHHHTAYVVVDLSGNPLRQFDTEEEANDSVEYEYPGRRIMCVSYDSSGRSCNNSILGCIGK